jgi:hypothetical protein
MFNSVLLLWWKTSLPLTVTVTAANPATLFLGGYKYRNLALQVGGVSDETVKYGHEFCGTSTQE